MKMYVLSSIVSVIMICGCKGNINGPEAAYTGRLCYEKANNGSWDIFITDLMGTAAQNISNYERDDEYPEWSPDGRYIAYSRRVLVDDPTVIVYDTKEGKEWSVTDDGGGADLQPQWTPDGRLCIAYQRPLGSHKAFYLMNPDGSNKRKILDYPQEGFNVSLFFYSDNYRFLYMIDMKRVYITNIEGTINEFVVDLLSSSGMELTVRDFNRQTGDLLVNMYTNSGRISMLATFNAETKQFTPIAHADSGYVLIYPRYSHDYQKIICAESAPFDSTRSYDQYLSVFENGKKRRLVYERYSDATRINFSWEPMQFSPDDRYIAFSKVEWRVVPGSLIPVRKLYLANVETGDVQFVDDGNSPSWDPKL